MKASESVKNYAASVRMYTNYTVREIKKICKEIGPRPAGYEAEKKAQEHMAQEMKTCADEVRLEEFKLAPKAFMSWIRVDGIILLISIIFSLLNLPIVSAVLTAAAFVICFCEFLMYWEFMDGLFPKKISHNVAGIKKATGETKQRIIFSGHIDSSYEWTYTHHGGKGLLYFCGGYAVLSLVFVLVVSLLDAFNAFADGSMVDKVLTYAQIACIPGGFLAIFFVNFKLCVEGANDNLTGAVSSVAILKYLKDNDISFEHTEVVALSAGAEESGLRGSKAYTKRHIDELKEIPTIFVGIETLRDYEDMAIYARDMTGTVKMDHRVCALLKKAALEAGRDLPYSSVYIGASDAAGVQRLGVPAATLASMNPGPPRYYHTRTDTADNMNMKTIENGLQICLNALFLYDEQGLKDEY
ncbi:MAG: M20/M25/M40 family metallo-hydrolase [Oscillospiraceae bacterium]|nr:M20/M25/M40 family metallo-hydrolase [Oscillospiraceae bacterium]